MAESAIISSKKLKSIQPALYVIIDGANLVLHTSMPRMLCKSDDIEIKFLKLEPSQVNIEELFHTLTYLQGTALNLAGYQRIFIRTVDLKLIQIDPRMSIPLLFHDFRKMVHTFVTEGILKSVDGNSILMKFVKNNIGQSIPPGIPRYTLYTSEDDKITPPTEFCKSGPIVIYVHLNPQNQSYDEIMQGSFCISNDNLSTGSVIQRVVKVYEELNNIW